MERKMPKIIPVTSGFELGSARELPPDVRNAMNYWKNPKKRHLKNSSSRGRLDNQDRPAGKYPVRKNIIPMLAATAIVATVALSSSVLAKDTSFTDDISLAGGPIGDLYPYEAPCDYQGPLYSSYEEIQAFGEGRQYVCNVVNNNLRVLKQTGKSAKDADSILNAYKQIMIDGDGISTIGDAVNSNLLNLKKNPSQAAVLLIKAYENVSLINDGVNTFGSAVDSNLRTIYQTNSTTGDALALINSYKAVRCDGDGVNAVKTAVDSNLRTIYETDSSSKDAASLVNAYKQVRLDSDGVYTISTAVDNTLRLLNQKGMSVKSAIDIINRYGKDGNKGVNWVNGKIGEELNGQI